MKSKSINEIVSLDSLAITAIISYWKDYDKTTVIISYLELQRRNFILDSTVEKKLNEFCLKHDRSLEELIDEYKNGDNFLLNTEYYNAREQRLNSEKENREKVATSNQEFPPKKSVFTPLNICLFLGLCIGCYLPIKYFLQSSNGKKCSDIEATTTVLSLLDEKGLRIESQNGQLKNIITTAKNTELNSCDCEATLTGFYFNTIIGKMVENPIIYYEIKQTDDGESVVSISTELN